MGRRLLLNYVLSDPYVDVALEGVREPRFVDLNNEISDDVASRIDLAQLHDRYVRQQVPDVHSRQGARHLLCQHRTWGSALSTSM